MNNCRAHLEVAKSASRAGLKVCSVIALICLLMSCDSQFSKIIEGSDITSENVEISITQKLGVKLLPLTSAEKNIFNTDDFIGSVKAATLRSPLVLSYADDYEAAMSDVLVVESFAGFQINSSVGLGGQAKADANKFQQGAVYNIGVSKAIFDGGRLRSNISSARLKSEIAKLRRVDALNMEAARISLAWIGLWYAEKQIEQLKKRQNFVLSSQGKLEALYNAGMIDKVVQLDLNSVLRNLEWSERLAEKKLEQKTAEFERVYGTIQGDLVKPALSNKLLQFDSLEEILFSSPKLQIARANVELANLAVEKSQAELSPEISAALGISPNTSIASYGDPDLSVDVRLSYQIGDGGRRSANIDSSTSNLTSAKSKFSDLVGRSNSRLKSGLIELEILELRKENLVDELIDSEKKFKFLEDQIAVGASSVQSLIQVKVEGFKLIDSSVALEERIIEAKIEIASELGLLVQHFDLN